MDHDSPAGIARRLLRASDRASLGTILDGQPYVSLVLSATEAEGAPLLLISRLAQHTRNLAADPHLSLLYDGTAGLEDPLTGPRVSVLGHAEELREPERREAALTRFVARHPSAAGYASFADFSIWRVAIDRAHLVAGFGKIDWISGRDFLPAGLGLPATLVSALLEEGEAIGRRALGLGWRLTGIDAEGADFRQGGTLRRLDFAERVGDEPALRAELARFAAAS